MRKKNLFGELRYTIKETPKYLDGYAPASFGMPMSLVYGGTDGNGKKTEEALKQLSRIEDGFVAEMGFSLGKGIAPGQLAEMLSGYDLWIMGMAVYSGEIKEVKISTYSSSGDAIYAPHLTLRPYTAYSDDGARRRWNRSISKDDVKMAADQMIKDLEWLTSRVNYDGAGEDKQRLAYLNGIQVFGAVVTGPVRELEKLKQVPGLRDFRLGRIEVWNWEKHKTNMP
ncbi:anti sigma factor C-terminal domain-containing protein [Paenibacillus sp. DMB20]|uniref:anti sigma factor C-terminal domain-containing protein n=1 Tax=Paenibacillus sp. DMB20 TaxID=1642570 RepID=UPI00069A2FE9|nr:anti sigma factor C-terminal domain-containing protein [Paenibacillus sp. DMB20]